MGLIVLPGLVLYLIMSVFLVKRVARIARQKGRSPIRWGSLIALVLYLIPFWDWIPTVVMHNYYCKKEAGFWVYKTLDQWRAENPAEFKTLGTKRDMKVIDTKYGKAVEFNQRFMLLSKIEGPLHFNRWKQTSELRDSLNGEILERRVNFSISQERVMEEGWKLWLIRDGCTDMSYKDSNSDGLISNKL